MKDIRRPQSMLLTINNNTKHNDIAYQYIQADIDKMNSFIVNIEQKADKLIPLIPPNLKNDISSLKKQSHQLSLSYSSINYNQYRNKLKIKLLPLNFLFYKKFFKI